MQWAVRREPRNLAADVDLPLELYLRQLVDTTALDAASAGEAWRLAAIWMAIAAKIGEAASTWIRVEPAPNDAPHRLTGRRRRPLSDAV